MKIGVERKREVLEGSCPEWILSPPVCLSHSHPPALPPGLDFPFDKGERVGLLNCTSYKSKNYLVPGTSQAEAVPGKGRTRSEGSCVGPPGKCGSKDPLPRE